MQASLRHQGRLKASLGWRMPFEVSFINSNQSELPHAVRGPPASLAPDMMSQAAGQFSAVARLPAQLHSQLEVDQSDIRAQIMGHRWH